ncbi:MAG: penicillin-binding protein activator [Deltaproteobacteria bacterium]|nr:penicillin-binding protein activator [Deltaproteobacteria bacterium]
MTRVLWKRRTWALAVAVAFIPATEGGLKADGPSVEEDFIEGKRAFEAKEFESAVKRLESFVANQPKHPSLDEALFLLGRAHVARGAVRDGWRILARLLRVYPDGAFAPEAWLAYGLALAEGKETRDAAYALEQAQKLLQDEKRRKIAEEALAKLTPSLATAAERVKALISAVGSGAGKEKISELLDGGWTLGDFDTVLTRIANDKAPADVIASRAARLAEHAGDFVAAKRFAGIVIDKFADGDEARAMKAIRDRAEALDAVKMTRIGVIAPRTGPLKAFGSHIIGGARVRAESLERIDIRVCDSATDGERARACVDKLVFEDHVAAIVGPIGLDESVAAADRANELGVPIVTLTPREAITQRGPWVLRMYLTNESMGRAMATYAMEKLEYKRLAILHPNSRYGHEMARAFWSEVEKRGGEIRGAEEYNLMALQDNMKSLDEPIQKLVGRYWLNLRGKDVEEARKQLAHTKYKGKATRSKRARSLIHEVRPVLDFEGLFIPDYVESVKLIAPYLGYWDVELYTEQKWKLQRIKDKWGGKIPQLVRLLGGNGWNKDVLASRVGPDTHMAVFCDGWAPNGDRPETVEFLRAYRGRTSRTGTYVSAVAFDAVGIVGTVLTRGNPPDRAAVRDAILAVRDFRGATGKTTFGGKRDAEKEMFYFTVEKKGGSGAGIDPTYEIQPVKDKD